jgi:Bacteriophage Sf6, terminase small subunit-like
MTDPRLSAPPRFLDALARGRKPRLRAHPHNGSKRLAEPAFRCDVMRAREIRGDFTFGEEILDIADNTADDWSYNEKTGNLSIQKEAILRSKIRIEARQFHMSRLHPQQWGDRQQLDERDDWSLLTEEERRRKADELIAMIRELKRRRCSRRHWSIAGKKRLRSLNRAGLAHNLDREPLGRVDGARLYLRRLPPNRDCGDSARSLDRGRGQGCSDRANAPSTPPAPFLVASPGFGSPSRLSRHKMITHESLKHGICQRRALQPRLL